MPISLSHLKNSFLEMSKFTNKSQVYDVLIFTLFYFFYFEITPASYYSIAHVFMWNQEAL